MLKRLLSNEPVAIGGTTVTILNLLIGLHVFNMSSFQLGLTNAAVVSVVSLFVRQAVASPATHAAVVDALNEEPPVLAPVVPIEVPQAGDPVARGE